MRSVLWQPPLCRSPSDLSLMCFQLGMSADTPAEFLCKAKEIVLRHKELQAQATNLQGVVTHLEKDQQSMVSHSSWESC